MAMHQLFFHPCRACGEGNAYYDRPGAIACDQCGAECPAEPAGEPFEDPALD